MSNDEDVFMDDVDPPVQLNFKGKGKATGGDHTQDENLPWCVHFYELMFPCLRYLTRVEKYRPVTLDDVVSHKDITSTSECETIPPLQ